MHSLPGVTDVHVDKFLTNLSIGVMNDPMDYIGTRVFPGITVSKISDLIPVFDQYAWLADEAKPRMPATESEGSGWTVGQDSYLCLNFAFHKDVPWELRANNDGVFYSDEMATMYVTDRMLMKIEVKFASDFFKPSAWTSSKDLTDSGEVQWDATNADIQRYIDTAQLAIGDLIIKEPKTLVIGRHVWSALKLNPALLAVLGTNQTRLLTLEQVTSLLDLDQILVARAIRATNKQGQPLVKARIMDYGALLLYVTPRPSLLTPNSGYTFYWEALGPGVPIYIRRLGMDLKMADRVEGHIYYDSKVTAPDAGYFFEKVISQ